MLARSSLLCSWCNPVGGIYPRHGTTADEGTLLKELSQVAFLHFNAAGTAQKVQLQLQESHLALQELRVHQAKELRSCQLRRSRALAAKEFVSVLVSLLQISTRLH